MKHDAFHHFLDHPDQLPQNDGERELALLFKEIGDLEAPQDPGQAYWNQFNHRLQNRLDQAPKPRRLFWARPLMGLTAMATMLVLAFFWQGTTQPTAERSLAALDSEDLMIIGEMYQSSLWDDETVEIADADLDLMLEVTNPLFDDDFSNLDQLDFETWVNDDQEG